MRLAIFLRICLLLVSVIASSSSLFSFGRSTFASSFADGFGAHLGEEASAPYVSRASRYSCFAEQLVLLERRVARIDDDVILVIDDALEIARGHVEHQADARRHALEEPDVRDRHGQFDVAHALAAHARERHFDAATIADDAAVLDALILSAGAFPVLDRTENALAEQAAFFRLERAVIDGLGVFDFALGPGPDGFRRGDGDRDVIEPRLTFSSPSNSRAGFFRVIIIELYLAKVALKLVRRQRFLQEAVDGLGVADLHVEAEGLHFLDEHVEGFRNAGFERVVAFDDDFVDAGAALHVVGFDGEQFLQACRPRRRLPWPRLPFRRSAGRRIALCRPAVAA